MPVNTLLRQFAAGLLLALITQSGFSADPQGRVFGDGKPFGLRELPPGRVKEKIESLPIPAQEQALNWLNRFSFHESDLEFINIDDQGAVFYEDTKLPDANHEFANSPVDTDNEPTAETASDVFTLHSNPGSSKVLYLDFDGHQITGTAWNYWGEDTYHAVPFNTEGDENTFSDYERAQIQEIWHRIAEDFAAFDVDVTTEEPASFDNNTGHVLITQDTDALGQAMPSQGAGGVAYVGVWGRSDFDYYSPALVYYDNLLNTASYIAEAASHEAGHNLGLSHDGSGSSSYYAGHGSGYVSWAPIMGNGYYNNVTQWSRGEYPGATQTQDDIEIITGHLDLRVDDHSDTRNLATELVISGGTLIEVSNPETDPDNFYPQNKGVIEDSNDVDTFTFVTGGGSIEVNVNPAWDAYYRTNKRGANLDIQLTLLSETNVVAVSDSASDTSAHILTNVPAGRYYLEITGVGSDASPYSDYASHGQYFINGTVANAEGEEDLTAPNPNPMTWAMSPFAIDRSTIDMTATTATDDSGSVEYQFTCVAGGANCSTSDWQSSPAYTASNLSADTTYSFQVVARDPSNNVTAPSMTASTTTPINEPPTAVNDSATTNEGSQLSIPVLNNDNDPEGDTLHIESVTQGVNGSTTISGNSVVYTPNADFSGSDTFTYTVADAFGDTASADVLVTVEEFNSPPSAVNDAASVATGNSVQIPVLANDSDPEGDTLIVLDVSPANKGSVSLSGNVVTYTAGRKRGNDTLTYTISDGYSSASATINVSIGGGNKDDGGNGGGKCHPKRGC